MRTTIDIDDDVLAFARERARPGMSVGKVISKLARAALQRTTTEHTSRNGVPLIPVSSTTRPVTLDTVNRIRDDSL